jgi:hypothetical protein
MPEEKFEPAVLPIQDRTVFYSFHLALLLVLIGLIIRLFFNYLARKTRNLPKKN